MQLCMLVCAAPGSELASVREDVQQLKAAVEVLTNATHLMAIPTTTSSAVGEPGMLLLLLCLHMHCVLLCSAVLRCALLSSFIARQFDRQQSSRYAADVTFAHTLCPAVLYGILPLSFQCQLLCTHINRVFVVTTICHVHKCPCH